MKNQTLKVQKTVKIGEAEESSSKQDIKITVHKEKADKFNYNKILSL